MSAGSGTPEPNEMSNPREVVVYTRPGCPYCFTLRARLRRAGLAFREINIWEDPDAAAFVRSVAGGNETVPTVVVGDVRMVNPSARRVRAIAAQAGSPATSKRAHWIRRSAPTGDTA